MEGAYRPRAAGIAAALAMAACAPAQSSTILPSGTYVYEVQDGAKTSVLGTVTISRDAGGITVRDDSDIGGTPLSTIRRLDPATFSVVSYRIVGDDAESVAISNDGATFHLRDGKTVTLAPRVLNMPSTMSDFMPSSVMLVPAILHASGRTKINQYGFGFMTTDPTAGYMRAVPSHPPRPRGAAATDVSIGIAESNDNVTTIWYDPATFVVSVVQAGNNLTIRLKPGGAAGEVQR